MTEEFHPLVGRIEAILTSQNVWFERFVHAPVITSEDAAALRVSDGYTMSEGAKSLIVSAVSRGGGQHFVMIVVPGDRRFDRKKLKEATGYHDIRFATAEEVAAITGGVVRGGVPPWGNLFSIPVLVDRALYEKEKLIFNAGDQRVSIGMYTRDHESIVQPIVGDITESIV